MNPRRGTWDDDEYRCLAQDVRKVVAAGKRVVVASNVRSRVTGGACHVD